MVASACYLSTEDMDAEGPQGEDQSEFEKYEREPIVVWEGGREIGT